MSKSAKRAWIVIGLALVVLLPVAAAWLRQGRDPGCSLDGMKIVPAYRVRVLDESNGSREFCSIRCAEIWLKGKEIPPDRIYVTNEKSGEELLASAAHFVRSMVFTTRVTGNRVHVFGDRADAESHAQNWRGRVLDEAERPFAGARGN